MEQLTYAQVRDMLIYVADQVIDSKAFLTEIDSQIGDGDHGVGIGGGMEKAARLPAGREPSGGIKNRAPGRLRKTHQYDDQRFPELG